MNQQKNVKLTGHYRYYGITWNFRKITTFLHRVQQFLFKAMNRRGCRRVYTWNGFVEMLKCYPLAKPKTYYYLYWSECYYEEPYAGKLHVRNCEGLRLRGLSLLDCRSNRYSKIYHKKSALNVTALYVKDAFCLTTKNDNELTGYRYFIITAVELTG